MCVPGTLRTEEDITSPEIMMVVNHHMGDRNRTTKSPARATGTLIDEPSLQPHFLLTPILSYLSTVKDWGIDFCEYHSLAPEVIRPRSCAHTDGLWEVLLP